MSKHNLDESENQKPPVVTLWMVIKSVLAAMFGVQSDKNRERDFTNGKPSQFIIVGLIAVFIFIMIIYGIVQLVMTFAVP